MGGDSASDLRVDFEMREVSERQWENCVVWVMRDLAELTRALRARALLLLGLSLGLMANNANWDLREDKWDLMVNNADLVAIHYELELQPDTGDLMGNNEDLMRNNEKDLLGNIADLLANDEDLWANIAGLMGSNDEDSWANIAGLLENNWGWARSNEEC